MDDLLIKNGRLIDPANSMDAKMDILVSKDKIVTIAPKISAKAKTTIDANKLWVTPGLIDIHVHFREPGYEYKETIESGSKSAAAGGFTSVVAMANTNPVNDCAQVTEFILEKANNTAVINVHTVGAVTKGIKGEALAEIGEMAKAGVVALSDDGKCLMNPGLLRDAMEYASMFDLVILEHAEDQSLCGKWSINEGRTSNRLGLVGAPAAGEDSIIARDITLSKYLNIPIHFCHVSTAGSVDLIRQAKKQGVLVTAEATPHHFTLTEDAVGSYDTNCKMAPPLRSKSDVTAIIGGLMDGTIDCIATDHAPHNVVEKEVEFDCAAFGIVGLETAVPLAMSLVNDGHMKPSDLIGSLSSKPAKTLNLSGGSLDIGSQADITIIDPELEWIVEPSKFATKGRNTPFGGKRMRGRAVVTIVKGRVVYKFNGKDIDSDE
ncbi:MAG TPA: dihydroorotase [Nitrospinota bacterium]|nr:dihydroorotase [Nitrospinota bacterium]|tara:strand:+ start:198220 stop:199521 length:1302 start_codon:yes stop_codon:yes gene_type:complete